MFGDKVAHPGGEIDLGGGLDGGEETEHISRARVTQGLMLSRGRGNSRDKMLIMRACLQTSVISFAVDVWSRHVIGGENASRDETKQSKTTLAKESTIFTYNYLDNSDNRPRNTCV